MKAMFLVGTVLLVEKEDVFAGPLDDNRAQPLASDRLVFQTRTWRVSMIHEKQLVGLVDVLRASGDTVQFSTHLGGTITAAWSQLPAAVQEAFATDRAGLLFPPNLTVEESLRRAGAKGLLGHVVQKLPSGLLVALDAPDYRTEFIFYGNETVTVSSRDISTLSPAGQQVVVKNLPNESALRKGDEINVVAFLQATFSPQGRTIAVFSAKLTR